MKKSDFNRIPSRSFREEDPKDKKIFTSCFKIYEYHEPNLSSDWRTLIGYYRYYYIYPFFNKKKGRKIILLIFTDLI